LDYRIGRLYTTDGFHRANTIDNLSLEVQVEQGGTEATEGNISSEAAN